MQLHRDIKIHKALGPIAAAAPSEFRIFRYGVNQSSHGDFIFDEQSAKQVMELQGAQGNHLSLDYEHQALAIPPVEAPAAGWFDLELRDDGLWATNLKWTDRAAAKISGGEYKYFSPAFEAEETEAGPRVTRIVNVALTNLPAMKNMAPLIAARVVPYGEYPLDEAGQWDGAAAEQRIKAWAGDDLSKYEKAFTWFDEKNPEALGAYKLPHHDVAGGNLVTVRSGVIAAGNAVSGSRGGVAIPEAEMASVKEHLAKHYAEFKMTPPWQQEAMKPPLDSEGEPIEPDDNEEDTDMELKMVVKALGLREGIAESEAMAEAQKLGAFKAAVVKLSDAEGADQALGIVAAWKRSHGEVAVLSQRLAQLEADKEQAEKDALIEQCVRDGKLPPKDDKMKTWLCSLPLAVLRGYVEAAPGSVVKEVIRQDSSDRTVIQLGDKEKKILRQLGVTEERYTARLAGK